MLEPEAMASHPHPEKEYGSPEVRRLRHRQRRQRNRQHRLRQRRSPGRAQREGHLMARGRHPTWQENSDGFSPNGGPGGHETSGPRAFYIAFWAVSLLFLLVTVAGVIPP